MKKTIILLTLLSASVQAAEMETTIQVKQSVSVVGLRPSTYVAVFDSVTGVPTRYIINYIGLDASNKPVARSSATFTPEQAAMIFPQLSGVMSSVESAINSNKDAIIQMSK